MENIKKKVLKVIYEYIFLSIACLFFSIGTSVFLLPNKLSNGGFSGLATIVYYFYDIPMSMTIILLNLPLFIIGYRRIGKEYIFKSIYGVIIYSIGIDLINYFFILKGIIIDLDKFISCIYGGIFVGLGCAISYKVNASTGGTDMLAHLFNSYSNSFRISEIIVGIDFIVVFLNLIVFKELEIGLYSWITIFIVGKIIDIFFEGINFCKVVFIISDKYMEISKSVLEELNRGATSIYAKGLYLNKEKEIIMCILKRNDVSKLKNLSKKIDKNAFIIVTDAREVYGLGFK